MAQSVIICLTSVKNAADKRLLTVTHGEPTVIGRASRTASKNMSASQDNALFDCQVMSRGHAELRLNQDAPIPAQITLVDNGSMHGTQVNATKLQPFIPMALRPGDRLHFGTRVTRGHEAHDGVIVTFSRISDPNSAVAPSRSRTGGYNFPDYTDSDSDGHSDINEDHEAVHVSSSAKTTPESIKARPQPGSAQLPIDLETRDKAPRALVISLDDNDDQNPHTSRYVDRDGFKSPEYSPHSPSISARKYQGNGPEKESQGTIAAVTVPESISVVRETRKEGTQEATRDVRSSPAPSSDYGSSHNWNEIYQDNPEFDDVYAASDSDASVQSYIPVPAAESTASEAYATKKQASPELGSALPTKHITLPNSYSSAPVSMPPHNRPSPLQPYPRYYSPLSTSQLNRMSTTWSQPRLYSASHAQIEASGWDTYDNVYAQDSRAARWEAGITDGPPTDWSQPTNVTNASLQHGTSSFAEPAYGWSYPDLQRDNGNSTTAISLSREHDRVRPVAIVQPESADTRVPSSRKAMAIDHLVEGPSKTSQGSGPQMADASTNTTRKRKADEITTDNIATGLRSLDFFTNADLASEDFATLLTEPSVEPSAARRKLNDSSPPSSARKIAASVAKYTAAAALGGVGTVAFLLSPLSDRMLEWIN